MAYLPRSASVPSAVTSLPSWTMARLSRIGRGWLQERLAADGLRLAHYATLETLAASGARAQRELAKSTGYDPSDMVAVLDHLQSLGLVERERDELDRRRQVTRLTAAGQATVTRCRAAAAEAAQRLLAPLGDDAPAFQRMLAVLLEAHDR